VWRFYLRLYYLNRGEETFVIITIDLLFLFHTILYLSFIVNTRGIQRTLKDNGYKTEKATFCTIVYQGISPNDIRDPLLATVKAGDLNYIDVQERLRQ
jgi:hypothetical protein